METIIKKHKDKIGSYIKELNDNKDKLNELKKIKLSLRN